MSGIGLGAGLMYLLDPDRGRRRRALVRDQLVHGWNKAEDALDTTAADFANRTRGLAAETKARFRHEVVEDNVLMARVRSRIGRVVSHPGSIDVSAQQGRVSLSGPILAREVEPLLSAVRSVRGVTDVENYLEVHERPDGVPGLQNGSRRLEAQLDVLQTQWSPTTRLMMGAAGGAMMAYCANRRDPTAVVIGTVGFGMLMRGATNMEVKRLVGAGGRRGIDIQKTITLAAPIEEVFRFWASYENFPRFMANVREVRSTGDGSSHWKVAGPAGVPVEWDAVLTEFVPDEVIAWKSVPGAAIRQTGIVRFEPTRDGGTRIHIRMSYNPPAGALGHSLAALFGADPKHQMDEDLARMKTLLETGQPARDAAQPSSGEYARSTGHGSGRERLE
jgi:uncharacterized membrane protein